MVNGFYPGFISSVQGIIIYRAIYFGTFQEIEIDVYEDDTKSNVKKSAKVALLLCC